MYCEDTMRRLNDEAVHAYYESIEPVQCDTCTGSGSAEDPDTKLIVDCPDCEGRGTVVNPEAPKCDYCDESAVVAIPVYHPADAVQDPPVMGAYAVEVACQDCYSKGYHEEETFVCKGCGKRFISHRLWDGLVIESEEGSRYCQKCALEHLVEPKPVAEVVRRLRSGKRQRGDGIWYRINNVPGYSEVWSDGYAPYKGYPGFQSLESVADAIEQRCRELSITEIIPLVTRQHQLSVKLGVFASYGHDEDSYGGD